MYLAPNLPIPGSVAMRFAPLRTTMSELRPDPQASPTPTRAPEIRRMRPGKGPRHRLALLAGQKARNLQLERDRDHLALVLRLNNLLASQLELERLFQAMSNALWQEIRHEFMGLSLLEPGGESECMLFLHRPEGRELPKPLRGPLAGLPTEQAFRTGQLDVLDPERIARLNAQSRHQLQTAGIRSLCCVPLLSRGELLGCLSFGSLEESHFTQEEGRLLGQIGVQFAIALDNALVYRNLQVLKDKLAEEKHFLQEEVESDFATREIVGKSPALMRVLEQIRHVRFVLARLPVAA